MIIRFKFLRFGLLFNQFFSFEFSGGNILNTSQEVGMKKRVCILLIFLWLGITAGNCLALGLEAAVGGWHQGPDGEIAYKGDTLSVDKDLNYDSENKIYGRAKIDLPFINFYLSATQMKFEGEGSKDINFQFGDKTFSANVPFTSRLELNQYDIAVFWGIPFLKAATKAATLGLTEANLELGINLRLIDFNGLVRQESTGVEEEKSILIPVPMLYTGLGLDFGLIKLEGEGRGITYSGHYFYDLIGRAKLSFRPLLVGPSLFLAGGYHYQKIKIDDISDITATLEISGPFLEIGGSF